jgi:acetyl-CoA carboxylase biotin carboxyl carrier protein
MPRPGAARAAERRVRTAPAAEESEPDRPAVMASITPEARQPLMDLDFLRGLIEAVDQSGIDTFEMTRAGTRIRISKTPPPGPVLTNGTRTTATSSPQAPPTEPALVQPEASAVPKKNLAEVKSPMVGTFYRAPAPEAPPYVEVGSLVRKGQTLCILEAMKLMNELEAEIDGVVREILVENADPVEYGQVLFRIEPNGSA